MLPYLLNVLHVVARLPAVPMLVYSLIFGRKHSPDLLNRFFGTVPRRNGNRQCVWLHAPSLGEVNIVAALLPELNRHCPGWDIVVSTATSSGYELAKQKLPDCRVLLCPFDLTWAARQAMARIRPQLFIVVELEWCLNLLRAARHFGARVMLFNGRLTERNQRFGRRFPSWTRLLLATFDLVLVQHADDAEMFAYYGVDRQRIHPIPSIKFDAAISRRNNPATMQLAALAGIEQGDVVLLAGSTKGQEEELLIGLFRRLSPDFPQLRLLLCPRNAARFAHVAGLLRNSGLPWQSRSALRHAPACRSAKVLLIDTVGELQYWWGTAQIAYVGGSLGDAKGGHSMIEPAAYGAAVAFGPHTQNFQDVVELLIASEAAVVVHDGAQLMGFVRQCLEQPSYARELGQRASAVVDCHRGAAGATLQRMTEFLKARGKKNESRPAFDSGLQVASDHAAAR